MILQLSFSPRFEAGGACDARRLDRGRGVVAGNGAEGDRTLNLLDATEALSQLSYRPAESDILACPNARCHDFGASERYTVLI